MHSLAIICLMNLLAVRGAGNKDPETAYVGMETKQDSLHWTTERYIESFLSGFFSKKIYDFFDKDARKGNDAIGEQLKEVIGEKLKEILQIEMKELKDIEVLKVGVSNISSIDEKKQADWAFFEVDINYAGKPYYYSILAFKGTSSMKDAVADADQNLVRDKLLNMLVPRGFHDMLNPVKNEFLHEHSSFEEEIFCHLYQKQDVERQIILTGHSLGGALAKLAGARIKSQGFSDLLDGECEYLKEPIDKTRIYTFGAPQIFQKDFIPEIVNKDAYTQFIIGSDPVPKLQLFEARKLFQKVMPKLFDVDESVETVENVNFSDFGHFVFLEIDEKGGTQSVSVETDQAEQVVENIRENIGEENILKIITIITEVGNHKIGKYFKALKTFIRYEMDASLTRVPIGAGFTMKIVPKH